MKIAVICANGKEGKLIVEEAIAKGADVTAVVRGENKSAAKNVIQKDLFDLNVADLENFDVVIDAFGAWTPEPLPQHSTSLKHLCDLVSGKETRLLVVGGAGSLYVNPEHTVLVMDGARTGKYIWGGEELTLNSKGESVISYADYAAAMVEEALNGNHIQQRISVVAE